MHEFYYRFKAIGIDLSDIKEIKKFNSPLTDINCLKNQFYRLEAAHKNATTERADIIINVLPDIGGAVEISVYHLLKRKLFSKAVKTNCFSLCVTKYDEEDKLSLYFYETEDFTEVTRIFYQFIENKSLPDLKDWKRNYIG